MNLKDFLPSEPFPTTKKEWLGLIGLLVVSAILIVWSGWNY